MPNVIFVLNFSFAVSFFARALFVAILLLCNWLFSTFCLNNILLCSYVLDNYRDYFTTPYFVFIRDALSYLVLLGLHFTICLETSSISFTWIEWAILVFFMGRVLFECEQFTNNNDTETVKNKTRHCRRMRYNRGVKTRYQGFTKRFSKYIR